MTSNNIFSSFTLTGGVLCRFMWTIALSTFGLGMKDSGSTMKEISGSV